MLIRYEIRPSRVSSVRLLSFKFKRPLLWATIQQSMEVIPRQASYFLANFMLSFRICFSNSQRAARITLLPTHANVYMSVTEFTYTEKSLQEGLWAGQADFVWSRGEASGMGAQPGLSRHALSVCFVTMQNKERWGGGIKTGHAPKSCSLRSGSQVA